MSSLASLLLQAAISLLLLVQANPHLDASLREQAVAIANQAIQVATSQTGGVQVTPPPIPVIYSTGGRLYLDPPSAQLKVGENVQIKAYYEYPSPPCASATPPCLIPTRAPQEVEASFTSSNPSVADVTVIYPSCPPQPPAGVTYSCAFHPSYLIHGVSPGTATITAV